MGLDTTFYAIDLEKTEKKLEVMNVYQSNRDLLLNLPSEIFHSNEKVISLVDDKDYFNAYLNLLIEEGLTVEEFNKISSYFKDLLEHDVVSFYGKNQKDNPEGINIGNSVSFKYEDTEVLLSLREEWFVENILVDALSKSNSSVNGVYVSRATIENLEDLEKAIKKEVENTSDFSAKFLLNKVLEKIPYMKSLISKGITVSIKSNY